MLLAEGEMRIVAGLGVLVVLSGVAAGQESTSVPVADKLSLARIVRLSQVRGHVLLNRNTGNGYEAAFPNLPIAQGMQLETTDGIAEVEFEDNSSMRLVPDTAVEFPTLQSGAGGMVSAVRLTRGTLYVSLVKGKGNPMTALAGESTVVLPPGSHVRLRAGEPGARVTVLAGSVEVQSAAGPVILGKNKAMALNGSVPVQAAKEEPTPFDEWDKTAAEYHKVRSVAAAYGGGSGYAYGVNDLNYYGGFSNVAGCGQVWRPYFTSAAWDPFANGIWAYYPGAGYSWVSPYPWAWTPYHSGNWQFCGEGAGWGWRPAASWTGLGNRALVSSPVRCVKCLRPPPAPITGRATLIISARPLEVSKVGTGDKFTFRADSAGLGVPREFGSLHHAAAEVAQHGMAAVAVAPGTFASPGAVTVGARSGLYAAAGGTGHAGQAGQAGVNHSSVLSTSLSHAASAPSVSTAGPGSSGGVSAGGGAGHH